jgi:hypothetical protein
VFTLLVLSMRQDKTILFQTPLLEVFYFLTEFEGLKVFEKKMGKAFNINSQKLFLTISGALLAVKNPKSSSGIIHILRNALGGWRSELALRMILTKWGIVWFCVTRGIGGVQKSEISRHVICE